VKREHKRYIAPAENTGENSPVRLNDAMGPKRAVIGQVKNVMVMIDVFERRLTPAG
jgi:hypothetical protein